MRFGANQWVLMGYLSKIALFLSVLVFGLLFSVPMAPQAQPAAPDAKSGTANAPDLGIFIPGFVDPDRRIEKPDLSRFGTIRFLTEDDYPPFHFIGANGQLSGFNIDLARLICTELGLRCTVQARRWDLLLPALASNEGDAVIASHRIDTTLRRHHEVSSVNYRVPARFALRKDASIASVDPETMAGRKVALVGGSSHEAFLNAFYPSVVLLRFPKMDAAMEAMRRGAADIAFGDGVSMAFWMNGTESLDCCAFIGKPFLESRFFGEGAGIVMRKGNTSLKNAIDHAIWRLNRDGRFAKLYLRHFPVPFY